MKKLIFIYLLVICCTTSCVKENSDKSVIENLVSIDKDNDTNSVFKDKEESMIVLNEEETHTNPSEGNNNNELLSLDRIIIEGNYTHEPSLNNLIREYSFETIDLCRNTEDELYFIGRGIKEVIFRTDLMLKNPEILLVIEQQRERYIDEIKVIDNSEIYGKTVICILNVDSYTVYDEKMNFIEEVKLPEGMQELIKQTEFRYWDINEDLNLVVFAKDDIGLNFYDLTSGEIEHIADNNLVDDDFESSVNGIPRFILDDQYISSRRFGYEGVAGYNLYNIEDENLTELNGAFSESIYEDKGLYIYYDDGLKATVYDFEEDKRLIRGLVGSFVDDGYEQGFNVLIKDKIVSAHVDYESNQYVIKVTDLQSLRESMVAVLEVDVSKGMIDYVFCSNKDRVYLYIPWMDIDKRLVSFDVNTTVKEQSVFTVNHQVVVDGQSDLFGNRIDFKELEGRPFNLYYDREYKGTYPLQIVDSVMEGEYEAVYDTFEFLNEDLFIGVPVGQELRYYNHSVVDDINFVEPYISEFLMENNIENMSYDITKVFRLHEAGNKIYLVHARDDQRNNVSVDDEYYHWKEKDYINSKKGFFTVDMIINLETEEVNVLQSGIWQLTPNLGFPMFEAIETGEFNNTKGLDILYRVLNYDYYEYMLLEDVMDMNAQ